MNLADLEAIREHADDLVDRHAGDAILIDANLLVLYLVGLLDPRRIASYKRTEVFSLADFRFVSAVAAQAAPLLVTPSLVNELSHLCEGLPETWVQVLLPRLRVWDERHLASLPCASHPRFAKLGLADVNILQLAESENCLVVTNDWRLTLALEELGTDVINVQRLMLFE